MLQLFVITVYNIAVVNSFFYPIVYVDRLYNYTPPEDEVTFFLYHRSDLTKGNQIIIGDEESLVMSRFDPELPTRVIVHGWTHSKDAHWVIELREAMAIADLGNIIVVDWAPLARVVYVEARVHNYVVAKQLTGLLTFLKENTGIPMSSVHLIGHSMGAQIAAMTGNRIKMLGTQGIGRITGLDPAAPLFEWPHIESLDDILDPSDALFVDVIHTNARHLGMITPAGHVDYYPNGGEHQDRCIMWSCSHTKSCEYFIASVRNPDIFEAYAYKSLTEYFERKTDRIESFPMGIAASPKIPYGIYYVEIGSDFESYQNNNRFKNE